MNKRNICNSLLITEKLLDLRDLVIIPYPHGPQRDRQRCLVYEAVVLIISDLEFFTQYFGYSTQYSLSRYSTYFSKNNYSVSNSI